MVVSLHSFSTRKQENIETDERLEIACVGSPIIGRGADTKTSQEGNKEQFLQ